MYAALDIFLDEAPIWMGDSTVRLCFTFRDAPEILGRKDGFQYFRVKEDLVGQEEFKEIPVS
jgi:hypothetical protein